MNLILSNNLSEIIKRKESRDRSDFKPNRTFFKDIGIGQKRFWQLVRNEKNLTLLEAKRLAEFFNVHVLELHDFTKKFLSKNKELSEEEEANYVERLGLSKS